MDIIKKVSFDCSLKGSNNADGDRKSYIEHNSRGCWFNSSYSEMSIAQMVRALKMTLLVVPQQL